MKPTFTRPILASVFGILGAIQVLIGVLAFLSVSRLGSAFAGGVGVAMGIPLIISGLLFFGCAEIFSAIGRIAFHSANLERLMENLLALRVEESEKLISPPSAPTPADLPPLRKLPPVRPFFYADGEISEGPFTVLQMRSLRANGTISYDTDVSREGDAEWQKYSAFEELRRL